VFVINLENDPEKDKDMVQQLLGEYTPPRHAIWGMCDEHMHYLGNVSCHTIWGICEDCVIWRMCECAMWRIIDDRTIWRMCDDLMFLL